MPEGENRIALQGARAYLQKQSLFVGIDAGDPHPNWTPQLGVYKKAIELTGPGKSTRIVLEAATLRVGLHISIYEDTGWNTLAMNTARDLGFGNIDSDNLKAKFTYVNRFGNSKGDLHFVTMPHFSVYEVLWSTELSGRAVYRIFDQEALSRSGLQAEATDFTKKR